MDTLEAMAIFMRVVERGSFSAVAREIGLSQPTISKQIGTLEKGWAADCLPAARATCV